MMIRLSRCRWRLGSIMALASGSIGLAMTALVAFMLRAHEPFARTAGGTALLLALLSLPVLAMWLFQILLAWPIKRMEEQLRRSEHDFRTLIENLPDPIFRYDRDCRRTYASPAVERISGKKSDELVGRTLHDAPLATQPQNEHMLRDIRRVLDTGQPVVGEVEYLAPDGRLVHFQSHFVPERAVDGQVVGVLSIMRDISERKRLEEVLAVRERSFRTLAENSPDPIYRYDRDCRRLYVNPVVGRILGKPVEALIGSSPGDGQVLVSEQNRRLMDAIRQVFGSGETRHIDLDFVDQDGRHRDYDMLLVPELDATGQVATVLALARDITAIRNAERRVTRLLANMPGFAYSVLMSPERHFSVPFASAGVEDIYGLRPEDLRDNLAPLWAMMHPADRQRFERVRREAERALAPFQMEFRVQRPGRPERWLETRCTPEREADNGILWHGMALDITERKRAQRELELLNRAISQSCDSVFLIDEQVRFIYVNDTACRSLGYGREELLGKVPSDIDPDVTFDMADAMMVQMFSDSTHPGVVFESRHRTRDGRIFPVEISATAFEDDGAWFSLAVAHDITERKRLESALTRREAEFRTLVEHSPDVIVRFDRTGRRTYCHLPDAVFGALPEAALLGKTLAEYSPLPGNVTEAYAAMLRQVMDSGEAGELEMNWERNGVSCCIHTRANPEFDGEGRVVSVLAVGRDISTLKQAEATLRRSHDLLRALTAHRVTEHEKERKEVADQIHEDLAQNLSALRLNIAMVELRRESTSHPHHLKAMRDIVDNSMLRIRDMVAMLRPRVLDLGLVPALQWLADDFKGAGFHFELALQDDIPLKDEAITFLFRAAQESLVNIALHAVATHIHLSLGSVAGACRLLVRDNGRGFDPGAPRMDGAFGLIGLMEQACHLGGDLAVTSSPGQGTLIQVHIPLSA